MALLNLRRKPKAAHTSPIGASGRFHTQGYLDYDEINANLTGLAGDLAYEKMWRTDGDIRRALTMCVTPIVGGTWTVDPAGDDQQPTTPQDEEVAQFVEWALTEHMRPGLKGHLWTALTVAGRFGRAPFETLYETATWRGRQVIVLKTLDLRLPRTIQRYMQDGPDLTSLTQFVPGGGMVDIPIEDLVFYRFGAEGDNWEGQSLLRPAYKHFKYKEGLELIQAKALERSAMGVPSGFPPQDSTPDEKAAFEEFLANVGAQDAPYFMAPGPHAQFADKGSGWYFEFITPKDAKNAADALNTALNYHSDKIAATVLEEFMRQGMGKVGTNATAETQQDPFLQMIEAFTATVIEEEINRRLIPRLVDLNFTVDRYPTLRCSLIDETTLKDLGAYVQALAAANVLSPEPALENYLRNRADLPERDEKAIAELEAKQEQAIEQQAAAGASRGEMPPDESTTQTIPKAPNAASGNAAGGNAKPPTKPANGKQLARQDRPLKAHEQHMALDTIEATIDGARARLEQSAGPHVRALAVTLAAQAAQGRKLRHAEAPADLTAALQADLEHLYTTGRQTVRSELASQAGLPLGTTMTLGVGDAARQLAARAIQAANAIRAAILIAAQRAGLTRDATHASIQQAAEQAGTAALRVEAQQHAAAALNLGRSDQAHQDTDLIAGARYTSILDGNRCAHCAQADDDVLRPLDDPVLLAHEPPNPDCLGGGRCRCMLAFQLRRESAPALARVLDRG